jgi:hypothetical protein
MQCHRTCCEEHSGTLNVIRSESPVLCFSNTPTLKTHAPTGYRYCTTLYDELLYVARVLVHWGIPD